MGVVVSKHIIRPAGFKNNWRQVAIKFKYRLVEIIPNEFAVLVEDLLKLAAIEVLILVKKNLLNCIDKLSFFELWNGKWLQHLSILP